MKKHYIRQEEFQTMEMSALVKFRGCRVTKKRVPDCQPKPFKSGFKTNTVKDVVWSLEENRPAFTFEEDDSHVSCIGCLLVTDKK